MTYNELMFAYFHHYKLVDLHFGSRFQIMNMAYMIRSYSSSLPIPQLTNVTFLKMFMLCPVTVMFLTHGSYCFTKYPAPRYAIKL